MSLHRSDIPTLALLALAILVIIAVCVFPIYRASVQSAVYARQGITLSTWECLMGIKPAESVIQVRERNTP